MSSQDLRVRTEWPLPLGGQFAVAKARRPKLFDIGPQNGAGQPVTANKWLSFWHLTV